MCSVTWTHPRPGELVLCFNRDEKHTRPAGLPPCVWDAGGFLAPRDASGGGTWLAVRRDGAVMALLNHYPAGFTPAMSSPTRGLLIPALSATDEKITSALLHQHISAGINPFRLLCLMPQEQSAVVFTWDGTSLMRRRLAPRTIGMLTSSSWNTAAVVTSRHAIFRRWLKTHAHPTLTELEAFHRETRHIHGPAWAVCMSRDDARTVSLDTLHLHEGRSFMAHHPRPQGVTGFVHETHRAEMRLTLTS
ncbi:MAG: hypothetical protein CJBNEKGG_00397 [Prosthecobacter sp.]|jgi:hypothetical protein|nr:hypothetical protein [Prosthecobacter sp.]